MCLNKAVVLKAETSFFSIYCCTEILFKNQNVIPISEKGEGTMTSFVSLFGFGVYFLLFVLAATMLIAFLWAKYSK